MKVSVIALAFLCVFDVKPVVAVMPDLPQHMRLIDIDSANADGSPRDLDGSGGIMNAATKLCWQYLSDTRASDGHDHPLWVGQTCQAIDEQKFIWDASTERIQTPGGGQCMDYAFGWPGKEVYNNGCHNGANQKFYQDSEGRLRNKYDDLCLEMESTSPYKLFYNDCHETLYQVFVFPFITSSPSSAPTTSTSPSTSPTMSPIESPTKSPTTHAASSSGDPHFKLWNGQKYDVSRHCHIHQTSHVGKHFTDVFFSSYSTTQFHGGCDLVLLKNSHFDKGLGLDIHIRTKIDTWWSFIESGRFDSHLILISVNSHLFFLHICFLFNTAVVRIGDATLEVTGGQNGGMFWINGILMDSTDAEEGYSDAGQISGFPVTRKSVNGYQKIFRIDLGNGDALSIQTYKRFVSVNTRAINDARFQGSVGMMGEFPHGAMIARNGTTVIEDPVTFGKEWQVLSSEPSLFHTVEGAVQPPQKCIMPKAISASAKRRRLGDSMITEEDAAEACSHVMEDDKDACIFDVLATNDKSMAGSY